MNNNSFLQGNSVFTKIGYDIISKKKNSDNMSKDKERTIKLNKSNSNKKLNLSNNNEQKSQSDVCNILNQNMMQNMINDLMEITKCQNKNIHNPPDYIYINKQTKLEEEKNNYNVDTLKVNMNTDDININLNNTVKNDYSTKDVHFHAKENETESINDSLTTINSRQKIIIENKNDINFNLFLWEKVFYFEINSDSKHNLSIAEHFVIKELISKTDKKEINFDIFKKKNLNKIYSKLMKLFLILLVYIKYILLDFNYCVTLRVHIKKLLNNFNGNLLNLYINFFEFDDSNEISANDVKYNLSKDFNEILMKIKKIHKLKKINTTNFNLQQYSNNLHKSLEFVISTMKTFSNTYFKIGYFKPLHTIIMDLFRNLDSIPNFDFTDLILNNILFYAIHSNSNDKQKETIVNKSIVFSPTNIINLYGLNIGTASTPYLPECSNSTYTLVLDLDETLVHFFYTPSGGTFLIRPFCFDFLEQMSLLFEITIFTAAMKDYADGILNIIDKNKKWIKYRLYRSHTSISGLYFVKDLSKLGRDLKKVIIIDNVCDNFKLQPNNGLGIKTWTEEIKDTQLVDISILLKKLISKKPDDVRPYIKRIKEEANKRIRKNINNPYKNMNIDRIAE